MGINLAKSIKVEEKEEKVEIWDTARVSMVRNKPWWKETWRRQEWVFKKGVCLKGHIKTGKLRLRWN